MIVNNAYCQHNEISWYDWGFLEKFADVHRFARLVIALHRGHFLFCRTTFFIGRDLNDDRFKDVHWYIPTRLDVDWVPTDKWLMCTMSDKDKLEGQVITRRPRASRPGR